jgi:hypothetical protein
VLGSGKSRWGGRVVRGKDTDSFLNDENVLKVMLVTRVLACTHKALDLIPSTTTNKIYGNNYRTLNILKTLKYTLKMNLIV